MTASFLSLDVLLVLADAAREDKYLMRGFVGGSRQLMLALALTMFAEKQRVNHVHLLIPRVSPLLILANEGAPRATDHDDPRPRRRRHPVAVETDELPGERDLHGLPPRSLYTYSAEYPIEVIHKQAACTVASRLL